MTKIAIENACLFYKKKNSKKSLKKIKKKANKTLDKYFEIDYYIQALVCECVLFVAQ